MARERVSERRIGRICVVGCPRSGTTVVQSLLGAHPDVLAFPETQFAAASFGDQTERFFLRKFSHQGALRHYMRLVRLKCRLATSESRLRYEKFCEFNKISPNFRNSPIIPTSHRIRDWVSTFDELAQREQKRAWSEKTPSHLAYVAQLRDLIPTLRVVFVRRNALNVIDSLLYANRIYPGSPAWADFSDLDYCIKIWLNSQRFISEYFVEGRDFLFDFDSFISKPAEWISELQMSLDLQLHSADDILSVRAAASRSFVRKVEPWKEKVSSELARESEAFRVLSDKDIEYIQERLFSWLKLHGVSASCAF